MATIKKSKKKIIVPICIILVIAIAGGSVFGVVKAQGGEKVSLHTIGTDDIHQTVSLTGDVSSGAKKEYKVATLATVQNVYVSVGDKVKKDDTLATFDTQALDGQIASLEMSYNDAVKSYNQAVADSRNSVKKADALDTAIKNKEKQVKKLQKKLTKTTKKTTAKTTTKPGQNTTVSTANYTVTASVYPSNSGTVSGTGIYSKNKTATLVAYPNSGYNFVGWYASLADYRNQKNPISKNASLQVSYTNKDVINYIAVFASGDMSSSSPSTTVSRDDLMKSLSQVFDSILDITDDVKTMMALINIVTEAITKAIGDGQLNPDKIAATVASAVQKAIKDELIDSDSFLVNSDAAVKMIASAVAAIDFPSLVVNASKTDSGKLLTAQVELASLKAQQRIYRMQGNSSFTDVQKKAVTTSKKALDAMKKQQAEMSEGWKAEFDGVITAVDITPGTQTTAITTGIVLENLDSVVVNLSLGEYDYHKVKVGMKANVTTAFGTYEGEVATIAPTADGGSASSLLDSVGSMAGISGLSSLTDTGAGVECTVLVKNADENITVGFDANVEIETGLYQGIIVVPNESIKMEKTGSYVYLYNEKEKTVTKTKIETGVNSDTEYEVISGLKPGDKIIQAPSSTYEEDTFKVKIVDSKKS